MAIGRPIPPLHLSSDERESLERWKRRPTTAQALALRSRIILRCSEGKTNTVVAGEIGLAKQTVGKWRPTLHHGHRCGAGRDPHPGDDAGGCNPLEHALHGCAYRPESERHQPYLAGLCLAAASDRDVQT